MTLWADSLSGPVSIISVNLLLMLILPVAVISLERFTDSHRKAFFGKCVVVIKGKGTLKAQAVDLKDTSVTL